MPSEGGRNKRGRNKWYGEPFHFSGLKKASCCRGSSFLSWRGPWYILWIVYLGMYIFMLNQSEERWDGVCSNFGIH